MQLSLNNSKENINLSNFWKINNGDTRLGRDLRDFLDSAELGKSGIG